MNRTNADRALDATKTLDVFQAYTQENDLRTSIVDLIANLGHLADKHGLDFDAMTTTAIGHWQDERDTPLKAYRVNIRETNRFSLTVEAPDEDAAETVATEVLCSMEPDIRANHVVDTANLETVSIEEISQ